MKKYIIAFIFFALGFAPLLVLNYFQTAKPAPKPRVAVKITPINTRSPTFALVPPIQSISGVITSVNGHLQKMSRGDTEFKEASAGAVILDGEAVATAEFSTAEASVSGLLNVQMEPLSEVVFANMLPDNLLLQQKNGKVTYHVTKPISIRALHSLIEIPSGEAVINIIDSDMSITVKSGSVKFALVDSGNNTNVWNLKAGERANIDDAKREVFLVSPVKK